MNAFFLHNLVLNEFFLNQMASFLKQEIKEDKACFWLGKIQNGKGSTKI